MVVLITGGAGYVGSHMVWELLDRQEQVVVIDDLRSGFESAIPQNVELIVGDVGDRSLVKQVIGDNKIGTILHFAGSVSVPESVADPLAYYENNTENTRKLVDAAVQLDVKHFVFSSTAAVYGTTGMDPVHEDSVLDPASPYGRSKLMAEWILKDVADAHELKFAILRYFNVAGADPQGRTGQRTKDATHLIKVAVEASLGQRAGMEIFGDDYETPDGTCMRDFIHVSDLVAAHGLAINYLRNGGESLTANLGYGHGYSVREIIDCVERIAGRSCNATVAPRRTGDLVSVFADSRRARSEFGWTPKHDDLDVIVSTVLKWQESPLGQASVS